MRRAILLVMILVAPLLPAQDDPDLVPVPVSGLPPGAHVVAWSIVETETTPLLVTEIRTAEGTAAFYVYDYVEGTLTARPVGARAIPADLSEPAVHRPTSRSVAAPGRRFWPVETAMLDDRNEQLLSAPSLPELRGMRVVTSPWQLSPHPESPLTIRLLQLAADATVLDECVLEPNILAVEDRMTTGGSWWVAPFGEPHLLVAMLHGGEGNGYLAGLRLYNSRREVVATAEPAIAVDANAVPDLIAADLSGDGEDELIFFATAPAPAEAFHVYRYGRRDGRRRVLAFNLCSVRMNGPDIVLLQRALEGRGYSVGIHGLDGWYGPDTRAAVIRFQRDAELPVTGVVDDRIWRLLGL
ncbi:MAG: peptidoglycan-binding domain-containing protein [Spirochaetota bacterium]